MRERQSVPGVCALVTALTMLAALSALPPLAAQAGAPAKKPQAQPAAPAPPAAPARRMTNDDVIALSKTRNSDERIVSAIRSAKEQRFATDDRSVAKLRRAGVSEYVISELRRVVAEQTTRSTLAHATTALLVNDGGPSDLRAQMLKWNRFKITERLRFPDVTLTFAPPYSATIRQRTTGTILWSGSADTWTSLLTRMKNEIPPHAPAVCVAVWCR